MSTVQGYLHLMRQGDDVNGARECRDQAYERLKDNIWNSPYRDQL